MIVTEPDAPLNDADHVGSFNLYGSEKNGIEEAPGAYVYRRTGRKSQKAWSYY